MRHKLATIREVIERLKGAQAGLHDLEDVIARAMEVEEALVESEARNRAILETAVDAIITIDEQGVIVSANPAAGEMFGYDVAEMTGERINTLMPSPYHEEHDGYLENYQRSGNKKIIGIGREVEGLRKDGERFPIHLSVSEIKLDGRFLFTGIIRDISEMKAMQREQEDLIERLQSALDQVKTLHGLIPICSNCKRIRDEVGQWTMLEKYLEEHSEAEFSHGLCNECHQQMTSAIREKRGRL